MRPAHLPSLDRIDGWPEFTPAEPLCVMISGCLAGRRCGVDGTSYGEHPLVARLLSMPNVRAIDFCPEDAAFGTPRATPDISGGDGFDVLAGRARMIDDTGHDGTDAIVAASETMRDRAVAARVHLAVLMDISAACGSSVIYNGPRSHKVYRLGPGVAAALLLRAGIPVVSQRDERTLARIIQKVGAPVEDVVTDGFDHYERDWYVKTFG
ncbi:MAG: DUF523 domain-containing protein [Polyangiaceae bacterium]